MKPWNHLDPMRIDKNMTDLIGNHWMLVTAGTPDRFNTMTASWGGTGYLWNRPVAFVFIRPTRYTYEFMETGERFTLSFFSSEFKKTLTMLGSKSGRDGDKLAETELTLYATELGNITFEEAVLVLECRKLYAQDLQKAAFPDQTIIRQWYEKEPLHKLYVAEIEKVWSISKPYSEK